MFLGYIIIFFALSELSVSGTVRKPNVLFIIVDDLRPVYRKSTLPALYDIGIDMPNIQLLAESGINFNNAYAQQALCAPSRHSLLTGRRPDTLRVYDAQTYWRETSGNFTTMPQYFKDNGYFTHSIGKVFHPGHSSGHDDRAYSWNDMPYHPSTEKYTNSEVCPDRTTKKLQRNLLCPINLKNQPEHTLPDLQTLRAAVRFLKRNITSPYFLAVGFHKPHIPFKFPKKYLEKIPKSQVHPIKYPNKPQKMPNVAWHPSVDIRKRDDIHSLNLPFPWGIMPKKWAQKIRRGYYASAIYIDSLIGKLLKHIDKSNTIIVLTSDHGWSLGENGLWAKYSNFEAALKVPLIFNVPNELRESIHLPVELIDVFPTLVELVKLPKIRKCNGIADKATLCHEGKSLIPLVKGNVGQIEYMFSISQYPRPQAEPCISTDQPRLIDISIMGYSIRTNRYRYTEWISFNNTLFTRDWNKTYGKELYDHLKDPYENDNLTTNPQYKGIKEFLSQLLKSKIE